MIQETVNRQNHILVASDRWHVLHARWNQEPTRRSRFVRAIISEHGDRESAVKAARDLAASLQSEMTGRLPETRDQALVRRPGYRSLKVAQRVDRNRR